MTMLARWRNAVNVGSLRVTALLSLALAAPAIAQHADPIPPEQLSWNGDPKAPDLSGTWIRSS